MIKVRVLLFAALRELLGKGDFKLSLPNGTTLGQLLEKLFPNQSERKSRLRNLTYAINYEIASLENPLNNGDEVALLPPMAGG